MKKLLILANSDSAIFKFRMELIEALSKKFEIGIAIPFGIYMNEIENKKYEFFDVSVNRHGTNPLEEIKLVKCYRQIISKFKPDVVLTYTIKPNIYGALVCSRANIPCLCNITGLGTAVENPGVLQTITVLLYKYAMRKVNTIFFQNEHGIVFFREKRIGNEEQFCLLPGSGVNLERFTPIEYPEEQTVNFLFVARVIKEKGIEEYIAVAKRFYAEGLNARFHICGACEEEYEELLKNLCKEGVITYHGLVKDMRAMYEMASCVVLPSYYPEGQSNVLLEGAASARPLITTDHPGCREAVDHLETGYLVKKKSVEDLYEKVLKMYHLSVEERRTMGLKGRKKVEDEFSREIIIKAYENKLSLLEGEIE